VKYTKELAVKCHEVDYKIIGDDLQVVEVELDRGESVIAEAGAMCWMDAGISFEARMGDGSRAESGFLSKVLEAGKRVLTGESLFITHFTNTSLYKKRVAFAAAYPGKIVAIDMGRFGGDLICQKDAFLCAALGTRLDLAFHKKLGAGLFGGEGFILQRISGDGMVFVHAGGAIVEKELNGETLLVDTGCLVGFSDGIEYDIERAGGLKSMVFGGEGIFLATLKGHGKVYLQSLPFSRLADRILANARVNGGSSDEGSIIGGAARIFER